MTNQSFWSWGIGGLIGAAIGAGSMYFSQQQSEISENHYFMELDRLRHAISLEEGTSFEEKLSLLTALREAKENGFRPVFAQKLDDDINDLTATIARIEQAEQEGAAAAEEARRIEEARAAAAAQERKEQAVRTNPLIFENCGGNTGRYCP